MTAGGDVTAPGKENRGTKTAREPVSENFAVRGKSNTRNSGSALGSYLWDSCGP